MSGLVLELVVARNNCRLLHGLTVAYQVQFTTYRPLTPSYTPSSMYPRSFLVQKPSMHDKVSHSVSNCMGLANINIATFKLPSAGSLEVYPEWLRRSLSLFEVAVAVVGIDAMCGFAQVLQEFVGVSNNKAVCQPRNNVPRSWRLLPS